jgi:elongation factor P
MISAGDLRKGTTLRLDGNLYRVVNTAYNKPGRGTATMRTTLMDIRTGSTSQRVFPIEDRLDNIFVESETVELLYRDGEMFHFMNTASYEQYEVNTSLFGDDALYLRDGMNIELKVYEGSPIDYELPTTLTYTVAEAEAAVVGDTAGSVQKKVKTDTGLSVLVPIFVNEGDTIKVDTRDGSYLGRA